MRIVRQTKTCGVMKYTRPRKKAIAQFFVHSFDLKKQTMKNSTPIKLVDNEA